FLRHARRLRLDGANGGCASGGVLCHVESIGGYKPRVSGVTRGESPGKGGCCADRTIHDDSSAPSFRVSGGSGGAGGLIARTESAYHDETKRSVRRPCVLTSLCAQFRPRSSQSSWPEWAQSAMSRQRQVPATER